MKILGFELKKISDKKSFMVPDLASLFRNNKKLPPASDHNYAPYLAEYDSALWVYACVSLISDSVASMPYELDDANGKSVKSPLLDMLNHPCALMTGEEMIKFVSASLELTGNAYLLKDGFAGKKPTQLAPLIASNVRIVESGDAAMPIKHYVYTAGATQYILPPEHVIHFRYFSPSDLYYGVGPLSAARMSVDLYGSALSNNQAIFDNGAIPDGVLTVEGKLDDDQYKRIMSAWNSKFRGSENSHKTAVLEGGIKYQALSIPQKDLDWLNGLKYNRDAICSAFRVPAAMVGIFEQSPKYNTVEQQQIFYNYKVIPTAQMIAATLARNLFPDFNIDPNKYTLYVDSSRMSSILSGVVDKQTAAAGYQLMGFTLNEVIDALDLPFPKSKEGDIRREPQYVMSAQSAPMLSAPTATVKSGIKLAPGYRIKKISRAELKRHQRERLALAVKHEPAFIESVGKTFKEKTAAILAYEKEHGKFPASYADVFDFQAEADKLTAAKEMPTEAMYDDGLAHEHEFLDKQIPGKRAALIPHSKAARKEWFETRAKKWSKDSEEYTRGAINTMLEDVESARLDGAGVEELKRDILDSMDEMETYRARRIAQTETIAALNQSAVTAYKETPEVAGKGWLSTIDGATRETHIQAGIDYGDGNEIPVGDDFKVGDGSGPAPGQIDLASESVNCRCTIYPAIKIKEA